MTFTELIAAIENERARLQPLQLFQKKILILTKPNQQLIISLCSLMSEGAVPVFLDPQLGRRKISRILQILRPDFISLDPQYLWLLLLWPQLVLKHNLFPKNICLFHDKPVIPPRPLKPEDISFISVTSGSTGAHKIVPITFENFAARQDIAHRYLPPAVPDVHHSGYVISCLQNLTEGATTILTHGQKQEWSLHDNTTRVSGPPGLLHHWLQRQQAQRQSHEGIQSVLLGGAPIPRWLLKQIQDVCPRTAIHIIYGSTEAEPISKASHQEIEFAQGYGYFVGSPLPEVQTYIAPLTELLFFPQTPLGKVGELCVTGKNVVQKYFFSESEERANKILLQDGQIWHRTGDLVIQNLQGAISLIGRKKDLISWQQQWIPNLALEIEIENIPIVHRVACLVLHNTFYCFLELKDKIVSSSALNDVRSVLRTWGVANGRIHILKKMPVDPRHHWKIQRPHLSQAKADQKFEIDTRLFHPRLEL